ncbi:MAG: hypothetical protein IPN33_01015 [Saprospiraceae bacterium]|nr:hypothetical protein [Saprospiraceae bacterium]
MKKAGLIVVTIGIAMLYSGCTKEYLQNVNDVCFERDVLPVFVSNCTQSGCHNSQDREEGYDFTTYESIVSHGITPGDYKSSIVYQSLVGVGADQMPESPYERLSDEQISAIALWIEQGADKTTCTSTCNTDNVTYNLSVKPILQNYCNGCHSGGSPSGNISYSTYNGVKTTVDNGTLVGSIDHAQGYVAMPQNTSKLSACNIAIIKKWVSDGAPNN